MENYSGPVSDFYAQFIFMFLDSLPLNKSSDRNDTHFCLTLTLVKLI